MRTFDREKAREVLRHYADWDDTRIEDRTLDALAGCVTDEPSTIDRQALVAFLDSAYGNPLAHHQAVADRILALLRPDPRIAKIEALVSAAARQFATDVSWRELRMILENEES